MTVKEEDGDTENVTREKLLENKALENYVKENVINCVHRSSKYEGSKGKQTGFNTLEHYAARDNICHLQLSFVKSLLYVIIL